MSVRHKNKTLTTLLALLLGGLGIHRFYLRGWGDPWGWLHLATVPTSSLLIVAFPTQPVLFTAAPLVVSVLAAFLETLVLGLIPDEKWDAAYNPGSGKQTDSRWPQAVLLVLALGGGAIAVIATLARTFDLLFTGGSYG